MIAAGWRPALRIAWRDAVRHRGRSVLVLVMIALPVLAVTAADVVYQTSNLDSRESLDRRLGAADARIQADPWSTRIFQGFDPDEGSGGVGGEERSERLTLETVRRVLGRDVPAVEWRQGEVDVDTERGVVSAEAAELDLGTPLTAGLFRLTSGGWPTGPGEAVVNDALAAKGFEVGSELTLHDGATVEVVGVAESSSNRSFPTLLAGPGELGLPTGERSVTWLVGGGPVSWAEVLDLNGIGATVLSRAVIEDPPDESALPDEVRQLQGMVDDTWVAVVALVITMALLEVVLLAGPAFAVGARRQQRTLALIAASGGTPKQGRRVILASGVVLGALAAALGVVLGIVIGWALLPVVQRYSDSWLGPFDVAPSHVLAVAAFGLLSALLAAVVPAWIASRQDVVAVLAGRRGDRRPSLRSPALGVVLLGAGVAGAAVGAGGRNDLNGGDGSLLIAGSAVVAVLGMILVVPVVVSALARVVGRLPLVARYAVRDAARHRTRTVPAVAAVAATVAGVVALGIANASDAAESEATYLPRLPMGMGSVSDYGTDPDWDRLHAAVRAQAPAVEVTAVQAYDRSDENTYVDLRMRRPDAQRAEWLVDSTSGSFGMVLVGDALLDAVTVVDESDLAPARRVLDEGGAIVFTSKSVDGDSIRFGGRVESMDGGDPQRLTPVEVPAYFLQVTGYPPALAMVAPGALDGTGLQAGTTGLLLGDGLDEREEGDLSEVLRGISDSASVYVERGYQNDDETLILLAVLGVLGGVLMLGGTLTATFLALSDARPDLATLSAVGASPRTRRGVAASFALVIGFVGAVLGAAVGFIPGVAISFPLTNAATYMPDGRDAAGNPLPSHFLDIPWGLVLGLVVVLPLLTAAIVGLTARSRLPLVARLE